MIDPFSAIIGALATLCLLAPALGYAAHDAQTALEETQSSLQEITRALLDHRMIQTDLAAEPRITSARAQISRTELEHTAAHVPDRTLRGLAWRLLRKLIEEGAITVDKSRTLYGPEIELRLHHFLPQLPSDPTRRTIRDLSGNDPFAQPLESALDATTPPLD